ncbi:hypothetical protein IEN87_00070 [Mycoplasma hominis]|nr:hypothetical protein [Metamycoplasma hominis]MBD3898627.1 hypothetical protein [Metamycoplasma hominis]
MDNRKQELKQLKKIPLQENWPRILILLISAIGLLVLIYITLVFKNKYEESLELEIFNDIFVSCLVGIFSGALLVLASFILLDVFKKNKIKNFFEYYCYLSSLKSKNKFLFFKNYDLREIINNKNQLTKQEFICFVAEKLNYTMPSIEYKNLVNEINSDFAKHSFLDPNFKKQKKATLTRLIIFEIVIPLFISIALIVLIACLFNNDDQPIRAIYRLIIILVSAIIVLSLSILIYELFILSKVKNYQNFNNLYLLSFNNYSYKYLNSSLVR